MDRMGHSTALAAMIYQYGSDERQRSIADAISRRATGELKPQRPKRSDAAGTKGPGGFVEIVSSRPKLGTGLGFCGGQVFTFGCDLREGAVIGKLPTG